MMIAWHGFALAEETAPGRMEPTYEIQFTDEQAQHGQDRYRALCGRCHGRELTPAMGSAPALTGPAFERRWGGKSVGDLYDRIRITMPIMTPMLEPSLAAALTAYLLRASGLPAGAEPLPTDREHLHQMAIPEWEVEHAVD